MKRMLVGVGLALGVVLSSGTYAVAKTPPEVLEPYKAYRKALKAGDLKAALSSSYEAWQAAELALGDNKTTGDLAQNYADLDVEDKKTRKQQIEAMRRAQALSSFYEDEAAAMYMQRGLSLARLFSEAGRAGKSEKVLDTLIDYALTSGLDRSILLAEAYTLKAGAYSGKRRGKRTIEMADRAIDIFNKPGDRYTTAYPTLAYLYKGFGHEYEEEAMPALLAYQKLIDGADPDIYKENNLAARALGRWMFMRSKLVDEADGDAANIEGLCKCYPFDIDRNESVKPIKRIPPIYPSAGLRLNNSGFTIVQFDLSDDGRVKNAKILTSWPPDVFEKSSLRSLKGWEYSPRAEGETDADRSNIVSTIRYRLSDSLGRPIF